MASLLDLLEKGYFPRELPPPFNSSIFAQSINSNLGGLPSKFNQKRILAMPTNHSIARFGTFRRKIGIPNPITQFKLCLEVANNWRTISSHIDASRLSQSKPVKISKSGRALSPKLSQGALPSLRSRYRMGAKYIVITDINNFYHSIYTHSIPWALHTKATAKADRSQTLLGNRLDTLARNGQGGQTVGIHIGPDTSLVLAEILLKAADDFLIRKLGAIKGFRYIDDYELNFSSLSGAEIALKEIESALSHFELSLNPRKTRILDMPEVLEDNWKSELSRFEFRSKRIAQYNDVISYFSKAFEYVKDNPNESVLRYAIARLRSIQITERNWLLLQILLLQCATSEPGTLPYVLEQFVKYNDAGYKVSLKYLEEVLNSLIEYHAPLGHGSEVAWSIWGALAFNVPIHSNPTNAVAGMDDSIVALLALDAEQRGLLSVPLGKSGWSQYMKKESLYEEHWLLSYEANVKGWLPSQGKRDHVKSDPCFGFLKASGVEFYEKRNARPMIPGATAPLPGGSLSISEA